MENKNTKSADLILLLTLICLGFYGGTGFFMVIGGNPAIMKMSSATFAEYWQHTDFYMAARMRIFGPVTVLLTIFSVFVLYRKYSRTSFMFITLALFILIIDLISAITENFPLNTIIQGWDLNNLPSNVQEVKFKVVTAFWIRSVCMMTAFLFGLLAFWKR
jgi:MFS superfamily sulfate permease-like transporter